MERLVLVAKKLRTEHKFNGYIHLKTIPGASPELLKEAGLVADRLSVNVEMPTEKSLALLAPDKKRKDMIEPMQYLKTAIQENKDDKKRLIKTPQFVPAGQSTQMVIGATPETDLEILWMADKFYDRMKLKRVYYSGYVPISNDNRLPAIGTPVPNIRENRLYQADWLMRFYQFKVDEIVTTENPLLDIQIDPKLNWALRNYNLFPVDINTADYWMIVRVPGIGIQSAQKIISARRYSKLNWEHLKKMGVSVQRVSYFIVCGGELLRKELQPHQVRDRIIAEANSKYHPNFSPQINLF